MLTSHGKELLNDNDKHCYKRWVTKVFGLNSFLDYLTRRSLNEELKVTPVSTNIIGSMKSFYGGKDYI